MAAPALLGAAAASTTHPLLPDGGGGGGGGGGLRSQPDPDESNSHVRNESARPPCRKYVFGFSPGHTGTTTLSDALSYRDGTRNLSSVFFTFEPFMMGARIEDEEEEASLVRTRYLPTLEKEVRKARHTRSLQEPLDLCVDLSHYNLYFFRGLLKVMRDEKLPFQLLRIRRDAVETARSLTHPAYANDATDERRDNHFHTSVGFNPLEAPRSIVLNVSNRTWASFSAVQQGLWMVDETEAQWQEHVDEEARRGAVEISWSKYGGPYAFVDDCLKPIASSLGLQVASSVYDEKRHTEDERSPDNADDLHELAGYRQQMSREVAAYDALLKSAVALPSSAAHAARMRRKARRSIHQQGHRTERSHGSRVVSSGE